MAEELRERTRVHAGDVEGGCRPDRFETDRVRREPPERPQQPPRTKARRLLR